MRRVSAVIRCAALGLLAASLLACDTPPIEEYAPPSGVVTASLIYPGGTARGNVYVFLFDADQPPPPDGFGRPVDFVVVPRSQLFGDSPEGEARNWNTSFTIPIVPPGRYQIRATLDADGSFNPVYDLLNQPTAGDVGGAFLDEAGNFGVFEVRENEIGGNDVVVGLGRDIPVERPAFEHATSPSISVPFAGFETMVLDAHPIVARDQLDMDPNRTKFLVQYVGRDADGNPIDANGDHLPDVYPSVLLRLRSNTSTSTNVVVPCLTNPLPFIDQIEQSGAALTDRIELFIPSVAFSIDASGQRTPLPEIPIGDYDTIVISGTGQTWTVPNAVDEIFSGGPDPTQSVVVRMVAGDPLPPGVVTGRLMVRTDVGPPGGADAFVFAFDERNPPPPEGTGRPVGVAVVPRAAFSAGPNGNEARYTLSGLPAGRYLLRGLYDRNSSFSPFVDLLAQADAEDVVGGAVLPVDVVGAPTEVDVILDQEVPLDPPGFGLDANTSVAAARPDTLLVMSRPHSGLGHREPLTRFGVSLTGADADGDNLPDLYPRALLTKIVDAGMPRTAADQDDPPIVIPSLVDPIPFLTALGAGQAMVVSDTLPIVSPGVALRIESDGSRTIVRPIPAGRYRLNVITPFAQSWSVPNASDVVTNRVGTPLEDPSQAEVVTVAETAFPGGAVTGQVQLPSIPAGEFQVVVVALDTANLPPPRGTGGVVASAVVPSSSFGGGQQAPYTLAGLATGTYLISAFLDSNDNFVPWFDTMNQPDSGDVGGGYFAGQALGPVNVDALGAPTPDITVQINPAIPYAFDRPVFSGTAGAPHVLTAVRSTSDVLRADGVFPVQWIDVNGDGNADDVNGDGQPDVYPLVVLQRLDPSDASNSTLDASTAPMLGLVDPAQFAGDGFPAGDPTQTGVVTPVAEMRFDFPSVVAPAPPPGRYRVTLINSSSQSWSVPNELQRAVGDPLEDSQSFYITIPE